MRYWIIPYICHTYMRHLPLLPVTHRPVPQAALHWLPLVTFHWTPTVFVCKNNSNRAKKMCDYTPEIIFRLSNKDQRFPQKFLLGFRTLYPVGFRQDLVFAHKILVSVFLEMLCTYNSIRHHFSRRTFMSGTEQNSRIHVCSSAFSLN